MLNFANHFIDCLKQKFSASELKENVEAIRQFCTQKCRDKGRKKKKYCRFLFNCIVHSCLINILGMILGQGGKILDKILGMILVHG